MSCKHITLVTTFESALSKLNICRNLTHTVYECIAEKNIILMDFLSDSKVWEFKVSIAELNEPVSEL